MTIASAARCLGTLKPRTAPEAGLVTYLTGALYYLDCARRLNYSRQIADDRRWLHEAELAHLAATELANGKVPSDKRWHAIVAFNSAIVRLDVAFERLARFGTARRNVDLKVVRASPKRFNLTSRQVAAWARIRGEVNRLKHRNPSALTRQRISLDEAIGAAVLLSSLIHAQLSGEHPNYHWSDRDR